MSIAGRKLPSRVFRGRSARGDLLGGRLSKNRRGRVGGRPKSLTEADLKKARALLRSGDYTKTQVAAELGVERHTLWRALAQTSQP